MSISNQFNGFIEKFELNIQFPVGVTTDGAKNMTGKNIGFFGRTTQKMVDVGVNPPIQLSYVPRLPL